MRRTKIVATIGPSSREPAMLERLVEAGVDVLRLNFSHGEHAQHLEVIKTAREIAARRDHPLALLQDLSGPKIRTGKVKGGVPIVLRDGARITITIDETIEGTPELISTSYDPLPRDVAPGDAILLDDGNLELRVLSAAESTVTCEVVHGGLLKSNKGMNLPGVKLSTPALTEKDRHDLAFGIQQGVDWVALSFVRQAADVEETKALISSLGQLGPGHREDREARGHRRPAPDPGGGRRRHGGARRPRAWSCRPRRSRSCRSASSQMANGAGKVVITATQMLESMIENTRPTRAEASDVANAILDGTDAVMLSGETAAGRFPVETVKTMARIALYTEEQYGLRSPARASVGQGSMVARSLARVAAMVAEELDCKLILAFTESGSTARLVSSFRPHAPIAAITFNDDTYRRLALWWGVVPVKSSFSASTDDMIVKGEELLKRRGLAGSGDTVLMLAGQQHTAGATNMMRVHTIA